MNNKSFQMEDKIVRICPPPIHEHYDPLTEKAELCGRVICPQGFVGLEVVAALKELDK